MSAPKLISSGVVVVVLGGFNPRIFEPMWLAQQQLVPETEARDSDLQIVDGQFARIELPWAILTVTADRLDVSTAEEIVQPEQVRDLVLGVLKLLSHTPARRMGLNRFAHFALASEEEWHSVGNRLAPKDVWKELLQEPGMMSLDVQGKRQDGLNGATHVAVQPSRLVHPGIFINVNDDILLDDDLPEPAGRLADILEQCWVGSAERADRIFEGVLADEVDG